MLNRRHVAVLVALLVTLLLAMPAMAQEAKKYSVFPFSYNGPKKYSYFPKAFQSSLNSDLEWVGKVSPAADAATNGLAAPKSSADAITIMRSAGIDYCVTGKINIEDKQATLKLLTYSLDGAVWEKEGSMAISEIAPWLDEQARLIQGDVFNRPGYGTTEVSRKQDDAPSTTGPINAGIISATDDKYKTDNLNPQFRYEGGTESQGRWRSQMFRFYTNSMVVGDVDGDGKNEVLLLEKKALHALRFNDGRLEIIDSLILPPSREHFRLELVDLDKDGTEEIVVATLKVSINDALNVTDQTPYSHILSLRGGKFSYLHKAFRGYLGVLRMPPTYTPVMVAQQPGRRHLLDGRINEAYLKDGKIVLGQKIGTPEFGNIYNMVYLPDEFSFKYVVLDDFHRMKVYSQAMEALYSSEGDRYNTSAIGIEYADVPIAMSASRHESKIDTYNIPFRMLAVSLSKPGKYELLANKDISVASQIFNRFNYFSQGEVQSLAWDGVGMNLAWKTRRIKGQVADLAVADLNNDGKKQLVVLVNTFPGAISFEKRKTVVIAYDLNI